MSSDAAGWGLCSEWLGFEPDARVLIVNADDLGMYAGINAAVIEAMEGGIVGSCSVMTTCPGTSEALALLRDRPQLSVGVHLTLVRDSARLRWGPLTDRQRVPSLVDETGDLFLAARSSELLGQARLGEVELELRAQIHAVLDAGLAPTHVDWHCLADGGRDDMFELMLELAGEFGLAARVWLGTGRTEARRRGLPVVDHGFLDSFALDPAHKTDRYLALLQALPAGLSEWAVHPGAADARSRRLDDGWPVRHTDLAFLTSPAAARVVREEGIVLIDYKRLQRAWVGAR